MSHKEYVADQDIDQLRNLIEVAAKRLEDLENDGWVQLWVVGDYANQGWFVKSDYSKAVEFMTKLANNHIKNGKTYELSIERSLHRPVEATKLLNDTMLILKFTHM